MEFEMRLQKIYDKVSFEVILCDACEGTGYTTTERCVDYHRRDYDTDYSVCRKCGGEGRLQATTTTVFKRITHPETVKD
jgi:hypothetical protein